MYVFVPVKLTPPNVAVAVTLTKPASPRLMAPNAPTEMVPGPRPESPTARSPPPTMALLPENRQLFAVEMVVVAV